MKFRCDKCSTRYSLSDEKVRNRVLKIRCKVCDHVMTVHGPTSAAPAPAPAPASAAPSLSNLGQIEQDAAEDRTVLNRDFGAALDAEWYAAAAEGQLGPMPIERLMDHLRSERVGAEDLVWHAGMDDWQPAQRVPLLQPVLMRPKSAAPKPEAPKPEAPKPEKSRAPLPPAAPASPPGVSRLEDTVDVHAPTDTWRAVDDQGERDTSAHPVLSVDGPKPGGALLPARPHGAADKPGTSSGKRGASADKPAPSAGRPSPPNKPGVPLKKPAVPAPLLGVPRPPAPLSSAPPLALPTVEAPMTVSALTEESPLHGGGPTAEAPLHSGGPTAEAPLHSDGPPAEAPLHGDGPTEELGLSGQTAPTPPPASSADLNPGWIAALNAEMGDAQGAQGNALEGLRAPASAAEGGSALRIAIPVVVLLLGAGLWFLLKSPSTPQPPAPTPAAAQSAASEPAPTRAAPAEADAPAQAQPEADAPPADAPNPEGDAPPADEPDSEGDAPPAPTEAAAPAAKPQPEKRPTPATQKAAATPEKPQAPQQTGDRSAQQRPAPAAAEDSAGSPPKRSGLAALDSQKGGGGTAPVPSSRANLPSTLETAQITSVFSQSKGAFRSCWERQLKRDPQFQAGRVLLRFQVRGDGTAQDIKLDQSIQGTTLESCLVGLVRRWRFPEFTGAPIPVEYPLIFSSAM